MNNSNQAATSIPAEQFKGNLDLVSYTVPDGITQIGHSAFYGCKNLSSITIPDSVTEFGYWVFKGCRALKLLVVPDDVQIDNHRLSIGSDVKIFTYTAMNTYTKSLDLNERYSVQEQCMIYELLNTYNPTDRQFRNLFSFMKHTDFNIILIKLQNVTIPENVMKISNAIKTSRDHWQEIGKHLPISNFDKLRRTSRHIYMEYSQPSRQ